MIKFSSIHLFALVATTMSVGCASTPKAKQAERSIEEYAPLSSGATWTYAVKYPGQEGEMVVQIVGKEGEYFMDNRNGYFQHTADGLKDKERYLIRYPLVAGNKWSSVVGPSAVEHLEILSVGEPCSSAAGSFADCLVVQGNIRRDETMSLEIKWTWARGVGLAKLETTADLKGKGPLPQVTQSLRHYDLEGKHSAPAPRESVEGGAVAAPPSTPPDRGGGDDGPDDWESE